MTDFEFLFALFGLLFGLIVAELSIKFADAIDFSRERPVGILTPALAFLVLTDVTSFWLFIWAVRTVLTVSWPSVFSGVLLAMLYFVAASLVFPRTSRNVARLDDHYWSRKRVIAAVMLFVNLVALAGMLTRRHPPGTIGGSTCTSRATSSRLRDWSSAVPADWTFSFSPGRSPWVSRGASTSSPTRSSRSGSASFLRQVHMRLRITEASAVDPKQSFGDIDPSGPRLILAPPILPFLVGVEKPAECPILLAPINV
jgi:hypothetical protein